LGSSQQDGSHPGTALQLVAAPPGRRQEASAAGAAEPAPLDDRKDILPVQARRRPGPCRGTVSGPPASYSDLSAGPNKRGRIRSAVARGPLLGQLAPPAEGGAPSVPAPLFTVAPGCCALRSRSERRHLLDHTQYEQLALCIREIGEHPDDGGRERETVVHGLVVDVGDREGKAQAYPCTVL
jgi:hypothetical protein